MSEEFQVAQEPNISKHSHLEYMWPFVIIGGLLAFLYHPVAVWLVEQWLDDRVYSHGFMVPLVSFYIAWSKRRWLATLGAKPRMVFGGALLAVSLALLLVGRVGAVVQLQAVSLLLILPSIVLFVWGWEHLKALAFPLLFLVFMVPLADPLLERIYWPFQLIAAKGGVWILRLLGFSVFQTDVYIQLPGIDLKVARECSGIAFAVSVTAVGLALTYVTQKSWWRVIAVLVSGIIITVLANSVRVAIAGLMVHSYGVEMLHGPGHIFRGMFVAVVGWAGIFLVNWIVCKFPSQEKYPLFERWKSQLDDGDMPVGGGKPAFSRPLIAVALVLLAAGIYIQWVALPRPLPLQKKLAFFPYIVGDWHGQKAKWLEEERFFLDMDAELSRVYRGPEGQEVFVYAGYLESQNRNRRLVSLYDKPLFKRAVLVPTGGDAPALVNHTIINLQGIFFEVVFWYDFPAGEMTGRYQAKIRTLLDALKYRRNNGAVILLATPLIGDWKPESISDTMQAFLKPFSAAWHQYFHLQERNSDAAI